LPDNLQPSQDNPLPQVRDPNGQLLKGKKAGTSALAIAIERKGERVWKKTRHRRILKARTLN